MTDSRIDGVVYSDSREAIRGYTELEAGEYTVLVGVDDGSYVSGPIFVKRSDSAAGFGLLACGI